MRLGSLVQNFLLPPRLILAYHRVAELTTDPWNLAVSPQNFAAQLEVLRTEYRPDSLFGLLKTGVRGRPANAIALTFDDGYADNLLNARPLLDQFGVPATFFVTTGAVDASTEFWWDAVERMILQTETLPERLTLVTECGPNEWSTAGDDGPQDHVPSPCGDHLAAGRFAGHVSPVRIRLYWQLWDLLRRTGAAERVRLMQQLHDWSGVPSDARPSHRTLTRDELVQLMNGDQVHVGAHSATHTPLTQLDDESQREEINQSKQVLDQLLGPQPFGFAYPHGDHDERTRALVVDSGYAFACTTQSGIVRRSTPRFQLPRCTVLDWNGDEFRAQLHRWQAEFSN